jgi:hypothetical protein
MSIRIKLVLLFEVIVMATLAACIMYNDTKPVGRLSRRDVRELRAAVVQWDTPWKIFIWANRRAWPTLIQRRLSLHITDIWESSIGATIIYRDGTRVERTHLVTISYRGYRMGEARCRAVKENGQWLVTYEWSPEPGLLSQ